MSGVEVQARRTPAGSGLIFGFGAYLLWGAMPIYFLAMHPAGPFEIVGWRIAFSVVFCAILLTVTRGWKRAAAVLRNRRTVVTLGIGGLLVYANWQVYVAATTSGHVVDAALGYFINPIFTVLLGVVIQRERLRPVQWVAVGISVVAVVVLTTEAHSIPVIALVLAASFGTYSLVKKRVGGSVDAISGLTIETTLLLPIAIVQLVVVGSTTGLAYGSAGLFPTLMLTSAGIGTAVPLLLFASAARRLPLTVIGFLQYLTPILQFVTGIFLLHEPLPPARLAGFCIVWVSLLLLIGESVWRSRRPTPQAHPVTDS
jgi:chloramphenicol-sensitive protein RarD